MVKKYQLNMCGPNVRYFRNQLGWSQTKLASKCQLKGWDISRDIIAGIERQIRIVPDHELEKLAKVLKIPIEKLLKHRN